MNAGLGMTQGAEVARGGALRGAMLQTQAQTDRPMTQVEQCMHVLLSLIHI